MSAAAADDAGIRATTIAARKHNSLFISIHSSTGSAAGITGW